MALICRQWELKAPDATGLAGLDQALARERHHPRVDHLRREGFGCPDQDLGGEYLCCTSSPR